MFKSSPYISVKRILLPFSSNSSIIIYAQEGWKMGEVSNGGRAGVDDDPWEVTSVKMRRSTKRAVKLDAVERDKTMQSVLEEALQRLLVEKSTK